MPSPTQTETIRLWLAIFEKPLAERGDNVVWGTLLCFQTPQAALQCAINQKAPAIKHILPCIYGKG